MTGFFTSYATLYIVTVEKLDKMLQSRMWYWDRAEALDMYDGAVDQYDDERIITVYSIDIQDTINERVDALMANRHSATGRPPLEELRSNRKAAALPVEYTPLRLRDKDELDIERTEGGDYWQYAVTKTFKNTWAVRDSEDILTGTVSLRNPDGLLPEYEYERHQGGVNAPLKASFNSLQAAIEALIEAAQ